MNETSDALARDLLASIGVREASIALTPIHGGRSGALTYRVHVADRDFVLRVQPEERFTKHFSQLAELQGLAGRAGVAPAVLAIDDERRAMLSEFIPSKPLLGALRGPDGRALLTQIGRQIAAVHRLPTPESLADRCPTERTREVLRELCKDGPEFVKRASARVHDLASASNVVCHLDLNPTNVLYDGKRVRFVDWETAGVSDPAFDLATLITLLLLDSPSRAALLQGYAEVLQPPSARHLEDARRHVYLGYGAEFLRLAGAPAPDWAVEELPSVVEAYGEIASGTLDMATRQGQWRLGAAYLGDLFRMPDL